MTPWTKQGSCLTSLVSFWPSIHQESPLSSLWSFQHRHNQILCCWPPSTIPFTRNLFFLLHDMLIRVRIILGSAGFLLNFLTPKSHLLIFIDTALSSIQLFAPLPSFINGSHTGDSSFIPFTWIWTKAVTLPFPAVYSRHFLFSFPAFITVLFSCSWWWWFLMITFSSYGLVIFEDKGHTLKVIAAMLISTNPCLILGIWSLAPGWTMVRPKLQRAAT